LSAAAIDDAPPCTPAPLTLTQALRRVLFASQDDDSSGIFARRPGSGQVIVRAQEREHLRICTEDVLRTIEDRDN
jgi:hypothetical protein